MEIFHFWLLYHSLVTEKQIPKVRITQMLALKYNIFTYLKYKDEKLVKLLGHTMFFFPKSVSILHYNQQNLSKTKHITPSNKKRIIMVPNNFQDWSIFLLAAF